MKIPIDAIIVPQGAEYKSVCQGLNRITVATPPVFPIPMGTSAVSQYLEAWQTTQHFAHQQQPRILLMGLCGSLSSQYRVGDSILYQNCVYLGAKSSVSELWCDSELTMKLQEKLQARAFTGTGLTSDRLIASAREKQDLGQLSGADVVDMEGFMALKVLSRSGYAVAMLRVISDDSHANVPNLTNAINPDGSLAALPLTIQLLRQPVAACRLIIGAMRGLQVLKELTFSLFSY